MITGLLIDNNGIKNHLEFNKSLASLEDGRYLVQIKRIGEHRTVRDWQEQYFLMLDIIVGETGNDRYILHDMFKEKQKLASTKELTTLEAWAKFIEELRWWAFANFDIAL